MEPIIDRLSFNLGMINSFVEMVACGVKTLALSPPFSPSDYELIKPGSDKIVDGFGMKSHLETQLISTLLVSDRFIEGKWVILYYKTEDVLAAYFRLKEKRDHIDTNQTAGQTALRTISKEFMQLLSYPDPVISAKLSGRHADPFLLVS